MADRKKDIKLPPPASLDHPRVTFPSNPRLSAPSSSNPTPSIDTHPTAKMSSPDSLYEPFTFILICCILGFFTVLGALDANERLRMRTMRFGLSGHRGEPPAPQRNQQVGYYPPYPYTNGGFEMRYQWKPRMQRPPVEEFGRQGPPPPGGSSHHFVGPYFRTGRRNGGFQPSEHTIPEVMVEEGETNNEPRVRKVCRKRAATHTQNNRGKERKVVGKKCKKSRYVRSSS
ncbi:MAG: hypothetical protein Q9208_008605 [Pyrenodesmia sp. 3 TL-2023]